MLIRYTRWKGRRKRKDEEEGGERMGGFSVIEP